MEEKTKIYVDDYIKFVDDIESSSAGKRKYFIDATLR